MQQHQSQSSQQVENSKQRQTTSDAVDKLLKQAEISRLTRNLKSKLALASMKTQKSPIAAPATETRRRAKTLEGAVQSPRSRDTPSRQRSGSRRSSVTSVSSVSSRGSATSLASPRARISRISSVNSITEANYEGSHLDEGIKSSQLVMRSSQSPQTTPLSAGSPSQGREKQPAFLVNDTDPLPSEPQTPPSVRRSFPKTPDRSSTSDGANLLLHFAHSPGRATPRTPDFNMNDYLHFQTPSPARGQLTPHQMKWGSLNSALFQPTGLMSSSKSAGSDFNNDGPH